MDNSFPKISYAEAVKSTSTNQLESKAATISWFEEVSGSQANTVYNRSDSISTTLSDDSGVNINRSRLDRYSVSHSSDFGHVSDLTSDNETCTKPPNECDVSRFANIVQRQDSIDSCLTSFSSNTVRGDSTTNDSQLSLILKRWASMEGQYGGDGNDSEQRQAKRKDKYEHDESVLLRRQKQIDYGKETIGYKLYLKHISRENRTAEHPQTPDKRLKYSRRAFDGLIKIWRKELHRFDPYEPSDPTAEPANEQPDEQC